MIHSGTLVQGPAAINTVTLALGNAEILGMIDPDGVGKTTSVNVLTGTENSDRGRPSFDGIDITG